MSMETPASFEAERRAWIFLNHVPHLGPRRLHRLLAYARSASRIVQLSISELQQADVGPGMAAEWKRCLNDAGLGRAVDAELKLEGSGRLRILTELDADYPAAMRPAPDRPPVLYVRGRWPPPEGRALAIVGTRRPTPYGMEVAEEWGRRMATAGWWTVSGMAAGIDAAAHRSTLQAGGYSVGVLGHGLRHRYPGSNDNLFDEMERHGALITEFPYEVPPQAGHFPRRNRVIAAMASAVLVVEAGEKSGALITARYAAELGVEVLAVPGRVYSPLSVGCHRLIKEGAMLAQSPEDLLRLPRATRAQDVLARTDLKDEEIALLSHLREDDLTMDELLDRTGQPVDRLAATLLSLELQNLIHLTPGSRYAIKIR